MPLAPNSLLQATSQAKAQSAPANALAASAEPSKDKASSFAQVYAKTSTDKAPDNGVKPSRDKPAEPSARKDAGKAESAAKPAVADSGKSLPADSGDKAVAVDDTSTLAVDALPTDPALDPLLVQVDPPVPSVPVEAAPEPAPATDVPLAAALVAAPVVADSNPDFDPEADPLDALPAVRLAMEQGGHVSASSQAPQRATPVEAEPTLAQTAANGVASLVDQKADSSTTEGGDKAFKGLIDDGLKDLKSASSDTRVDDFANRLAALTQAATPKTANAIPVNQPLAMHQGGWTDEVVNRVMYLSSANLKSADIQLEPAELGRLDIRVNMAADQPTQVNFVSGHVGVREALEGQMFRLRELFAQQGMGQVDVNVSDQSRGWQQGQDQAQQGQRSQSGSAERLDDLDDESIAGVTESVTPSVVLGSSAVDYYA